MKDKWSFHLLTNPVHGNGLKFVLQRLLYPKILKAWLI